MQDFPSPADLAAAVADFLRRDILPSLSHHLAFQTRVAINALDLIARQNAQQPQADIKECARLQKLLGAEGDLAALNAQLAAKIADGAVDLSTPGLAEHLWATTLEKLAVDQPNYKAFRAEAARTP
jgi:hypothetical protein